MTTIFLNLGPRQTGDELLPQAPFRAFVKFKTAFDDGGGAAALPLIERSRQIGTAVIDWNDVAVGKRQKGGKYFVGDGYLDLVEIKQATRLTDEEKGCLILDSMKAAQWTFYPYDAHLSESQVQAHFKAWISDHLDR